MISDELVANKSFTELLRATASRAKVKKSLKKIRDYNLYPKAVESPGRYINAPGMQEVVIDWRHYTNKEIAAAIARKRPQTEPEPNRRGREPQSKALLKALSVMRISKLHERRPWQRLELVAKVCGYKVCKDEWAEHKARRDRFRFLPKEAMGNKAQSEMSRARGRALSAFQFWFPWGKPFNY